MRLATLPRDSVDAFLDEYRKALHLAGKTQADVERLDEQRRVAFSEAIVANANAKSVAIAEHMARTSEPYGDAVAALDVARETAAAAKADVVYYQARFDAWRTKSATKRTEMSIEAQK